MTEHFIKWANNKGYTIVLSKAEIAKLRDALNYAEITAHEEVFEDLDVDYSPILDEVAP